MSKLKIVLVGIGGYGRVYVNPLLENIESGNYTLEGVVDPFPENCLYIDQIKELKIPIYHQIDDFYNQHNADLCIISAPIHFHQHLTCFALEQGSHVLCEKPISGTQEEVSKMLTVKNQSNKKVGIGYQWSYSEAIQALKKDIIQGVLGKPIQFKTLIHWPRDLKYYNRSWAGKKFDNDGRPIFDSIANNATAHHIHNMFYVLGDKLDESDYPETVTAEVYRANDIETFDTVMAKIKTKNGVDLFYYASHAVNELHGPIFSYEFEDAIVNYEDDQLIAKFNNGEIKRYGNPNDVTSKLWSMIESIIDEKSVLCGIEAALPQVICVDMIQKSNDVVEFPKELVKLDSERNRLYIEGLDDIIFSCYEKCLLPNEMNIPWAKQGKTIKK